MCIYGLLYILLFREAKSAKSTCCGRTQTHPTTQNPISVRPTTILKFFVVVHQIINRMMLITNYNVVDASSELYMSLM